MILFILNSFISEFDKLTWSSNIIDLILSTGSDLISDFTIGEKLGNHDHNIIRFSVNILHAKKENIDAGFPMSEWVYQEDGDIGCTWDSFTTEYTKR